MSDPYIGEIRCFAFNFATHNWALCNGQIMQIANNTTLYSVIGTTYGGDGRQTFALPNLQGQIPMHWGHGPGGFATVLGQVQGTTGVTLTTQEIPRHQHIINAADPGAAMNRFPAPTATSYLSGIRGGFAYQKAPVSADAPFSPSAITPSGNSNSHDNMQPYLALSFCICTQGLFPQHN